MKLIWPMRIKTRMLPNANVCYYTLLSAFKGETRPDFSKVGNRVFTSMPLFISA